VRRSKVQPASWAASSALRTANSAQPVGADALGPVAQPSRAHAEVHQRASGPAVDVQVAGVHAGHPLRPGHPVQGFGLGMVRAAGRRAGARAGPDPAQRRHRLPRPHSAQVRTKILNVGSRARRIHHGQHPPGSSGPPGPRAAEPDVDLVLLAARGPVPARHGSLQQVAFQPGRLVHGRAGHRFDPGHLGHHPGQVPPAPQVRPVRPHPRAQLGGPPHVQDPAAAVPEAVHARLGRQPPHHRGPLTKGRRSDHPPSMRWPG
jgi:hypothetical protein